MEIGKWRERVVETATSVLDLIQKYTPRNDPLGRFLIGTVLVLVCVFFSAFLIWVLGRYFYEGALALVAFAMVCIVIVIAIVAFTHYGPPGSRNSARISFVLVFSMLLVWRVIGSPHVDHIYRDALFEVSYLRLMSSAIQLQEFMDAVPSREDHAGPAPNLDSFFIDQAVSDAIEGELNGTNASTLDQSSILYMATDRSSLLLDGPLSVSPERWRQHGALLLAAKKVTLGKGAVLHIGGNSLIVLTYELHVEPGSRIVAFDRTSRAKDISGSGSDGSGAGNLYLVLLGPATGKLSIDLTGEEGENGRAGEIGEDKSFSPPTPDPQSPIVDGQSQVLATGDPEFSAFMDKARHENETDQIRPTDVRKEIGDKIQRCTVAKYCIILSCNQPPSQAARGNTGGTGGPGDNGGDGGRSGKLVIRSVDSAQTVLQHISISTTESDAGYGGPGGRGGRGGPPGPSGKSDLLGICAKPNTGEWGEQGSEGQAGLNGRRGELQDPVLGWLPLHSFFGQLR